MNEKTNTKKKEGKIEIFDFWKKIWKKNFFFQNFHFYSALRADSRGARNIMRVLKIFS